MARSPLIDGDHVDPQPPGRDTASLGPSDSSDTGSDVANLAPDDGSASDSGGTGERRGAGRDADIDEGADIAPDRVFEPSGPHDSAGPPAADTTQDPAAIGAPLAPRRPRRRGAQHGGPRRR